MKADQTQLKRLTIQVEFYEYSRAIALLRSFNSYSITCPEIQMKCAKAKIQLDKVKELKEPKIEIINGKECMLFLSKM